MNDTRSCLATKLSNFIALSDDDRRLLAALEEDTRSYPTNRSVLRRGDPFERLFVVKRGWLYSSTALADGQRQVMKIHYPGDIIGLDHVPFQTSLHDLDTCTDVELCPFPKDHLDTILVESPRLTALLFTFGMIEQAVLYDRLRVIGRMRARDRICHFLLSIQSRLRLTTEVDEDGFSMPLNQTVLGDALGLTNVSVSRALTALEGEGVLSRRPNRVQIHEHEALCQAVEFEDRFARLDSSWFPQPGL